MKYKLLPVIFCLTSLVSHAQKGLEHIIVEKYYISNSNDTTMNSAGGELPVGSVTYRIYVDMKPGCRFQAAYGLEGHELKIATTTKFFNNQEYGGTVANVIPDRNLKDNTIMLDSWLSAGAASESYMGILKAKDNGENTILNNDGILQNSNPEAGIPLSKQDGFITGNASKVTGFGIDKEIEVFNKKSNGSIFSTTNGSWAALYGAVGPDSTDNKVLIAQLTTNGVLSFELNIQIGNPYGGVERYVAKNPVGEEILFPELIYNSSTADTSLKSNPKTINKK